MRRFLGFLIVFWICGAVFSQQNTIGVIEGSHDVYDGYTLFSPVNSKETYLIDNCGRLINQWTSEYNPGSSVYLREDGTLIRTLKSSNPNYINPKGPGGGVELFDWEGNLVSSFFYNTGTDLQHHDIALIPNGNILLLAWDYKTTEEAIQAGRNPELITEGSIWSEQVIEIDLSKPENDQIVWRWNLWDHLVQDYDETKDNYGVVADNPQLVDINFTGGTSDADWIHTNSLDYNAELDQILIGSRDLNEIWIIDHSTSSEEAEGHTGGTSGSGGDLLYRWGNQATYDQGTESDQKLFGQHNAHWIEKGLIDEGKIMIFNNGLQRPPEQYSSIDVINPEMVDGKYVMMNGVFGPSNLDWQYKREIETDFYSFFMSGAHRLPNGGTLICSTSEGKIFELDSDNNVVWTYINPDTNRGVLNQGDAPLIGGTTYDNYVFRATKYPITYGAFVGRDLTPANTIETGESLSPCNLTLADVDDFQFKVYPNPVADVLNVSGKDNFRIISFSGQEVYNHFGKRIETITIDTDGWSNGFYFLVRDNGETIKLLKN